ncbi:MBL fold metallo-hydrolase [Arthrobacter echini]|uniref:MBL fold metallo-hydrolase n=1 Tax=Arthrobacter echini TaxID=1529066 RepID=A0A5D0XR11_9MICC|nr:MBL fold metallo-hydrolase [Arthrobacter echini]TYC98709.1 MBL fold metallo-hydrolase [Arthrobacter echini]
MYDLSEVTIRSISVSEMDNNVYLLTSKSSGAQVLIDAADDPTAILALIADAQEDTEAEVRVALIITTHSHWDHVRALADVREATKARTAAGADDVADIEVPTDVPLHHRQVGSFEGFELEALHLRGHTPGSVALLYRDPHGPAHLFTGDSLFPGGVGRTTSAEDFTTLLDDVTARVFDELADDTLVHPGHGAGTTLGAERGSLAGWRQRGW